MAEGNNPEIVDLGPDDYKITEETPNPQSKLEELEAEVAATHNPKISPEVHQRVADSQKSIKNAQQALDKAQGSTDRANEVIDQVDQKVSNMEKPGNN